MNSYCCLTSRNFTKRGLVEWGGVTNLLGYETISDMLFIMYVEESVPLRKIAKKLGFSWMSVRVKLMQMKVKLKSRGGNNNPTGINRSRVNLL